MNKAMTATKELDYRCNGELLTLCIGKRKGFLCYWIKNAAGKVVYKPRFYSETAISLILAQGEKL